jgi:protein-disulfide isomerase
MANRSQAARSRRAELEAQRLAQAKKQRQLRIVGSAVGLVVIAVVVGLTIWGVNAANAGGDQQPPHATEDGRSISLTQSVPESAPTLEIFADFQCPGCKQFHDAMGDTVDEFIASGDVNVVFHLMTFLDDANVQRRSPNLKSSTRASVGVACADFAGKYLEYYDAVFDNQPATEGDGYADTLLRETVPAAVGIAGEDLTAFQTCYDQQSTGQFAQRSDDAGSAGMSALGSRTTPTYALDGVNITEELAGANDKAAKLKELVDKALD